jgi:UDP-N-acetylmuramoyl-tripeptide--D-alanyl-D-alanine ligase
MGRPEGDTPASPQPARRRTWAVLGEMLELGADALDEHDRIGRLAVRLDISRLVAVGAGARAIHTGASQEGSWGEESAWVPDAAAALALLRAELAPGDVVLVKASRSVGLDVVAAALLDDVPVGQGDPA